MDDRRKTKAQLIDELNQLRNQISTVEKKAGESSTETATFKYRSLVRALGDVVYEHFVPEDRIVWWGALKAVLGYSEDEIGNDSESWLGRVHPDDLPAVKSEFEKALSGDRLYDFEYRFQHKDAHYVWMHDRGSMNVDENGELQTVIGFLRDITDRKIAENSLEQMAAIIESSDDAIIGKSLDGIITSWNSGAERLYGYAAAEVIGKPVSVLLPPGRPDELPHILSVIKEGTRVDHFETMRLRKDGEVVAVSLAVSPIRSSAGKILGASSISRDITHRKRSEEALKASEERFRMLMEQSPVAIELHDLDGFMIHANPAWAQLWGVEKAEEIIARYNIIEDAQACERGYDEAFRRALDGKTTDIPEAVYDPNISNNPGRKRVVHSQIYPLQEEHGNIRNIVITHEDITDRKAAEEALRQSEAKFRSLAEGIDEVFWLTQPGQTERVIYVSPAYEKIWGQPCEDVYQNPRVWVESIHPDDRETIGARFESFLKGESDFDVEFRIVRPDGSIRWIWDRGFEVPREDPENRQIAGLAQDITARKEVEARLRELATTDGLTGIFNRRHFIELGMREYIRAKRYNQNLSLLIFDVDHFKSINDRYGHSTGDQVLGALTDVARGLFREVDVFGRIGGEEFAVLLPETDLAGAAAVGERLRRAVEKGAVFADQGTIDITISVGVATYNGKMPKDLDTLMKKADTAMYAAKSKGRNRLETG